MRTTALRLLLVTALVAAGAAASVVAATPAPAADCTATWVGPTNGDWGTAANWSPAVVPSRMSIVCITGGGPTVAAGYAAIARRITLTDTAMSVDGTLDVNLAYITDSDLSGAGVINGIVIAHQVSSIHLTRVRTFGALTLMKLDHVYLDGSRPMCGGRYSVCLGGTSRISATDVQLTDAVLGGTTTAQPALQAFQLHLDGQSFDRITVDVAAAVVDNGFFGSATAELDRWEQLTRPPCSSSPVAGHYPSGRAWC